MHQTPLRTCMLLNFCIFSEGYSMAVATVSRISYAILGAPRYKHQGQVIVSQIRANFNKLLDSPKVVHLCIWHHKTHHHFHYAIIVY